MFQFVLPSGELKLITKKPDKLLHLTVDAIHCKAIS